MLIIKDVTSDISSVIKKSFPLPFANKINPNDHDTALNITPGIAHVV